MPLLGRFPPRQMIHQRPYWLAGHRISARHWTCSLRNLQDTQLISMCSFNKMVESHPCTHHHVHHAWPRRPLAASMVHHPPRSASPKGAAGAHQVPRRKHRRAAPGPTQLMRLGMRLRTVLLLTVMRVLQVVRVVRAPCRGMRRAAGRRRGRHRPTRERAPCAKSASTRMIIIPTTTTTTTTRVRAVERCARLGTQLGRGVRSFCALHSSCLVRSRCLVDYFGDCANGRTSYRELTCPV